MIGASAGLTWRMVGCAGRLVGSWALAALIAAWTCWNSDVRLWPSWNWMVTLVDPSELAEVIWLIPGISENWRSSGVATLDAIVSGLAPGRLALTCSVGKSTFGRADTGRMKKATMPTSSTAAAIRVVATGRLIKGAERFKGQDSRPGRGAPRAPGSRCSAPSARR